MSGRSGAGPIRAARAPSEKMGAGIAAGPHCPVAANLAWEARHKRRGVSKVESRLAPRSRPSGVRRSLLRGSFRFPRRLPDRGRSPGGSPFDGFGTEIPLPSRAVPPAEAFGSAWAGSESRSFRFRLARPWTEILGSRPFRSFRSRSPELRRTDPEPKLLFVPSAMRRPEGPAFRLPVPPARRPLVPDGRCMKPAAFASAGGQARNFRLAAASSAALPSASADPSARRLQARHPPGLWLGRLSSVAGESSRPRPEAVTKKGTVQAQSACG